MRIGRLLFEAFATPFSYTLAIRWLTREGLIQYLEDQARGLRAKQAPLTPRVPSKPTTRSIGR